MLLTNHHVSVNQVSSDTLQFMVAAPYVIELLTCTIISIFPGSDWKTQTVTHCHSGNMNHPPVTLQPLSLLLAQEEMQRGDRFCWTADISWRTERDRLREPRGFKREVIREQHEAVLTCHYVGALCEMRM